MKAILTPKIKLGEIAKIKGGKRLPKGFDVQNEATNHPYIRVTDMDDNGLILSNIKYISDEAYSRVKNYTISSEDIYISIAGTIGRVGVVPESISGANLTENAAKITKIDKRYNQKYIMYFLQENYGQGLIKNKTGGTSQPKLPLYRIAEICIPDLKKDKQDYIVGIVNQYDNLIDINRRRIQLLEESARLLFREWFVYFRFPRLRQGFGGQAGHEKACPVESRNSTGVKIVDGLPEGWASQPIATISDCVGGGTPSTSMPAYWVDGDITWVTPTDVTRNKHFILLDSEKKITEAGLQNSSAKLVPAHTVLMTSRASVGFFAIANREVCTNQGFISIVPHDAVFSLFLLFQLSERVEEIRAMGSGSTYPEVSRGKFRDFKVIIPPKKLVSDFDEQASFCFKQISNLKQQNQKLAQARDLLLPRLMSGAIEI